MLFNYTTHFLVLYYFSSSSPPKVRGVREELKLFLFYFFISTFYISLKKNTNVRNPLSLLSLFPLYFMKFGRKYKKKQSSKSKTWWEIRKT